MKKLFLLLIALSQLTNTYASHLMGGEITWECIKSGPKYGHYVSIKNL